MDTKRFSAQKLLRCGYTTGSCAAAAAKAATAMMLTQSEVAAVKIETPKGQTLTLDILDASYSSEWAGCAVKKDSGDDPDVTDGVIVRAEVMRIPSGVSIDGGKGVGRVTKAGLDQKIGSAAINSGPRGMIEREVLAICGEHGYQGGISVIISVPEGEELAKRTFNPRIGIEGGISILGTSGIVEPMSNLALINTIRVELSVLYASGEKDLLLTIGNYAEAFARDSMRLSLNAQVKCGNFIGDTLAAACELGFGNILVVGHIGKLVKLGIGLSNTHSGFGDGRLEALAACALEAGASLELLRAVNGCVTTVAAVDLIREHGILPQTMSVLGGRIDNTLRRLTLPDTRIGFYCFEGKEILTQSDNAERLAKIWCTL